MVCVIVSIACFKTLIRVYLYELFWRIKIISNMVSFDVCLDEVEGLDYFFMESSLFFFTPTHLYKFLINVFLLFLPLVCFSRKID